MAPSTIRKALGAVKDQTSIGLAKVTNSNTTSDLDVAIVKATRHDEFPAEEKHIREILSLTCYSRANVSSCISSLSRRLGKTRSWAVALKTLILVHRLLLDGDPAYEQEVFFATRRGTRMLNMSDFRDTSRSDAWDFSAFVRTYAMYLDERLAYRMRGKRGRRGNSRVSFHEAAEEEEEGESFGTMVVVSSKGPMTPVRETATPVREMKTEKMFVKMQHLQHLLERFLACRPTGAAKSNRIVAVALYPLVKESFQLYFDMTELMSVFIDRFTDLDVADCVRVHDLFSRVAKQLEELEAFFSLCKSSGICRASDFPDIEHITPRKLALMEDFIRDKSARKHHLPLDPPMPEEEEKEREDAGDVDMSSIKALPAPPLEQPEQTQENVVAEAKKDEDNNVGKDLKVEEEVDLLNLKEDVMSGQEHGDKLALALFDGGLTAEAAPKWEAFDASGGDWETALVQSASGLATQKTALGGGLDMMVLDGMYSQAHTGAAAAATAGYVGSASSVAVRAPTAAPMLALPAPPINGGTPIGGDPFAASLAVPPPAYVQMSEMEKKQKLLSEEQMMWQHYARDGMQGQMSLSKLQQQQQQQQQQYGGYYMGGYNRMY